MTAEPETGEHPEGPAPESLPLPSMGRVLLSIPVFAAVGALSPLFSSSSRITFDSPVWIRASVVCLGLLGFLLTSVLASVGVRGIAARWVQFRGWPRSRQAGTILFVLLLGVLGFGSTEVAYHGDLSWSVIGCAGVLGVMFFLLPRKPAPPSQRDPVATSLAAHGLAFIFGFTCLESERQRDVIVLAPALGLLLAIALCLTVLGRQIERARKESSGESP